MNPEDVRCAGPLGGKVVVLVGDRLVRLEDRWSEDHAPEAKTIASGASLGSGPCAMARVERGAVALWLGLAVDHGATLLGFDASMREVKRLSVQHRGPIEIERISALSHGGVACFVISTAGGPIASSDHVSCVDETVTEAPVLGPSVNAIASFHWRGETLVVRDRAEQLFEAVRGVRSSEPPGAGREQPLETCALGVRRGELRFSRESLGDGTRIVARSMDGRLVAAGETRPNDEFSPVRDCFMNEGGRTFVLTAFGPSFSYDELIGP